MEDRYQIEKTDDDIWTVRDTGLTGDFHYLIATYPAAESAQAVAAVLNDYADEEI